MNRRTAASFLIMTATAALFCFGASKASAQRTQGPPNALQGFSQNRDQPLKIQAPTFEVRDKDQIATFSGGVHVVQGDTEMRSRSLVVYYDADAKGGLKAAEPGPSGQQQIRRIEAKGGVVVTQKEQNATGDTGVFDMRSNTVTLVGNVVVTKGQNVLRGQRLIVDLTNGVTKMDQAEGLFLPGGSGNPRPGGDGAAPLPRPSRAN